MTNNTPRMPLAVRILLLLFFVSLVCITSGCWMWWGMAAGAISIGLHALLACFALFVTFMEG